MENKDNGGAGCLIILVIIILVALSNMKEENKKHTEELEYEFREWRNELVYRR